MFCLFVEPLGCISQAQVVDFHSHIQVAAEIQGPDEVETAKEALGSLGPDDEKYFSALSTFADSLVSRFALSGDPNDLDEGISRTKQVLDLAQAPSHFFHLAALCNMGQALIRRFKFRGDSSDLTQAISYFEAAMESCTPEQSLYLPVVASLVRGLLNRYWRYGDVADLDRIVETSSTALSTCRPESPSRDVLLNNFAIALQERFMKRGNRADLDTALMHYQSCLDLRPPGHPSRHSVLGNLADAMLLRFEVDGHLQDLESAANLYVSALQLRAPGQEGYLLLLTSLGTVFLRLSHAQGDAQKMEMAIDCYKTAMGLSTVPNLDHSRLLDNYGAALQSRFTLFGSIEDLDLAVQYLTTSSDILPPTYSSRPITLFSLGTVLFTRYNAAGNIADLDSSIEKLSSALELCEPGFHQRPIMLSVYGRALSVSFKVKGDIQDLDFAASTCKDTLALSSLKGPNYPSIMANLTSTLLECFYRSGNIEECQTIIDHCDRALVSTRPAEPAFIALKINRAKAFLQKFQYGREETDVDISIAVFREIIPTLSKEHAEYVPVHLQIGIALATRFKRSADPKDLDEAIAFYRVAKNGCKRGNFNYVPVCMQLGNALRERFEYHLDSVDALDKAIVLLTGVEELLSPTPKHFDYKASLVNLGIARFVRFQNQRSGDDLDAAIEHVSRALTLPASYEEFLVSFTLATLLSVRHTEQDDLKDLERCVELFGVAAEQMPLKHLNRGSLCRNYGKALVKLGYHRDRLRHLDAAIVFFVEALEHLPVLLYDQPLACMDLAEALRQRAILRGDYNDIYNAITLVQNIMNRLAEDSPVFHIVCRNAATLSMSMYELSIQLKNPAACFMEDGFRYYEKAAPYTLMDSFTSVAAALEWVEHAEKRCHSSALLAYQNALASLNQHLLTTASIKSRHATLLDKRWDTQTSTLATNAAACAIARGQLGLAVELSEQGRGLLWSQLSQSRTPLDALRSTSDAGRALASEFERVSAQLAQITIAQPTMMASRLTVEKATRRYRQFSKEFEDIVARIRQQEGFQSFLDRPSFQSLQRAALGGPVILVNISRQRCDALIVLHDAPPRLVPLSDTSLEDLSTLSAQFYRGLKTTTRFGEEKLRERQVVVVLRALWDSLVRPIVDELSTFLPRGARIWWCPTSKLTTLPLHAAGPYRKNEQNLPNIYVSSYTPTLAALIRARHRPPSTSSPRPPLPAFVAIGQATPTSTTPSLRTVDSELDLVQSLVPPSMPFSALSGDASTADAALAALGTHPWAHLACHGHPSLQQPFDSSFALLDRALTVLDIVRTTTGAGEFAFLSACHTAVGDAHAPDEILHLAAAMQFAGFRSVVGTMWAVDDGMVRHMVEGFYTYLFPRAASEEGPEGWDCTQAARALNKASKSVDKNLVTIDQRIVFIHIGA